MQIQKKCSNKRERIYVSQRYPCKGEREKNTFGINSQKIELLFPS